MTDADQPALWRSSDAAAVDTQRRYMFWIKAHLAVLAACGLISAWSPDNACYERLVSGAVALLMFGALMIGLLLKLTRIDDIWFRTRALAENAKAAAWRFAMKPKPATTELDEAEARAYEEELAQLRKRFSQLEKVLVRFADNGPQTTPEMQRLRSLPPAGRLEAYVRFRLQDQIDWYRNKAKANANAETRWFYWIFLIEALAIVVAVSRIFLHQEYNPVGGVTAMAAGFVAWSQTKRFSDLATSYAVACDDLKGLREGVSRVHDDTALLRLVADVEGAISREHRLWVVKRTS